VKPLAKRVADYVRSHQLLRAGHRAGIAVSGGLDSVALLRLALELRRELGIVLSVVHFNHRLRGDDAEADQQFVANLASQHELEFHCQGADVRSHSRDKHLSLEAAARELRYQFFYGLLKARVLDRIVTAHTLDDQAETVILRLARGAGTRGLAGIYPQLAVNGGAVVRPLLRTKRAELQTYLRSLNQEWREDKSNLDLSYTRNRVRHGILPSLERDLNPKLREALAETADVAREEEAFWNEEVSGVLPKIAKTDHSLGIPELIALPVAVQRRVVRHVAELFGLAPELKHVREILQVAIGEAGSVELPGGWSVTRSQHELHFRHRSAPAARDYEYSLPIPGSAEVPEAGALFEAVLARGSDPVSNSEELLDPSLLQEPLIIRNWRAGDRFWPAHSKAPKKIKKLLQDRQISGPERGVWPVVASGQDVVWLRGFPAPAQFLATRQDGPAVRIRERPLWSF
jgi:tRNA(Ile)-lysidine synthase